MGVGDNKAYVIIKENKFTNNMAYFSGNAVYIRSTKRLSEPNKACVGVHIEQSQFQYNFGMKKHNGGAATILCDYLTDTTAKDYKHTSAFVNVYIAFEMFRSITDPIQDLVDTSITYDVYMYAVGIISSTFDTNFSGMKGTAVYMRGPSKAIISGSTFTNNAPTYSF